MTMGDRIAILDGGELQQVATPLECYHEPANVFVAGFLGEPSMNFYDVDYRDGRLVGEAFDYPVSDELAAELDGHTELVLGVRPESIELVGTASLETDFETVVDVVEPTGDENTVYLTFAGSDAGIDGNALVATTSGLRQVQSGQSVVARIPERTIHLFDRSTGRAIHNRSLETEELADVRPG
jgi:multiple sugar transport system ATP-binding protein